ncbi:hypothetical protein BH11BAC1_BH11BAC1_20340 [soil metagenome]
MDEFLKILSVILISSVKFAFGPSFVYFNENYDFTFLETNLFSIFGGMLGVWFFLYLSKWLLRIYRKIRAWYFHVFQRKKDQGFSDLVVDVDAPIAVRYDYVLNSPKKKVFTTRNRRIIKIWQSYGLVGLAALTPIIFSIPIGTFIMARFESNNKKILWYMLISITCWSLILTSIFEFTHVRNIPEIVK